MFLPLWFPAKVELSWRLGRGLVPSSSGCTGDAFGWDGCCAFVASWGFLTGFLGILLLKSHRESFVTVQGPTHLAWNQSLYFD